MKQNYLKALPFILLGITLCSLLVGCQPVNTTVVGTARTQINSKDVVVYSTAPPNYEVIALIEASDDTGWTAAGSQENAINIMKKQAAEVGANGVILERIDTRYPTFNGVTWAVKTAIGKAIYVHQGRIYNELPVAPQAVSSPSNTSSKPVRRWKKPVD
ncbi:hypothetical protein [Desulfogranum marinum]|uniref:hypothetical protein n=1 Tax=Desulfogranum marinum TaxID=453220 RepID=UPI0029C60506|nr:hypothetical protein [Desulfogranum marinum]